MFEGVRGNPRASEADAAGAVLNEAGCAFVVGLGAEAGARRRRLISSAGLDTTARKLGVAERMVEGLVDDAIASGSRGLTASPVDLEREDLVGIYRSALKE